MRKKPSHDEISRLKVHDVFFVKNLKDVVGAGSGIFNPDRSLYFAMREDGALLCGIVQTGRDTYKPGPSNSKVMKFKTGFRFPGFNRLVRMVKTPAGVETRTSSRYSRRVDTLADEAVVLTAFETAIIKSKRDKFRKELYENKRKIKKSKKSKKRQGVPNE